MFLDRLCAAKGQFALRKLRDRCPWDAVTPTRTEHRGWLGCCTTVGMLSRLTRPVLGVLAVGCSSTTNVTPDAGVDGSVFDANPPDGGSGDSGNGNDGGPPWSGILAPSRAADWTRAGVPGGVPNRTTICANISTGDTTAQIQQKMDNCTANQVVLFPAGTWNLTGSIYANKGIVLRGAGPTHTFINLPPGGGNIFMGTTGSDTLGNYPPSLGSTDWVGGLSKGSTVLMLASTAGIATGQHIVLDQDNDAYVFPFGVNGQCTAGNSCGRNDSPLQFNGAENRAQPEIVEIQSVDSATQITVAAPGVAYDHSSTLAPSAPPSGKGLATPSKLCGGET
jgi:hypothetical protein